MTELTKENYQTAYKVLEQVREDSDSSRKESLVNDTHYYVQLHQEEAK